MIFKYTFINHNAEKLQKLLEHIVLEVWCKSRGKRFYLNTISDEFRGTVSRSSKTLRKPIHEIYKICSKFNQKQLDAIKEAFEVNNNIEKLCQKKATPILYKDLEKNTSKAFTSTIKKFFDNLYSEVFNQASFQLNNHYDEFFKSNTKMCPTCGLEPLEATADNHREDYDHYLPKSEYPFNAVNLYNLIPICTKCNQYWKKTKNPIYRNKKKTKAYFYYSTKEPQYDINVTVHGVDPCQLEINLTSVGMKAEVETWEYLFNLSNRYKEMICHDHIGLGWHREVYTMMKLSDPILIEEVYRKFILYAKDNPLDNMAFLKAPFLEDCLNKRLCV